MTLIIKEDGSLTEATICDLKLPPEKELEILRKKIEENRKKKNSSFIL